MSWSHVNSNKSAGGGAGQANITLTGCQQGDLLLWIGTDGAPNNTWENTGVTDDAGNTYVLAAFLQTANSQNIGIWMARHATGAGTVVVNGPEGGAFTGYIAAAYRHSLGSACVPILDGVMGKQILPGSGTDYFTSDAVASHSSDGLCVGVHLNDDASATLVAGTGFTLRQSQDIFSGNPLILEDKACGVESIASTATPGATTKGFSLTLVFTDASLLPTQTISPISIAGNNDDESGYRSGTSWAGIDTATFAADIGLAELYVSATLGAASTYFVDCLVMRFNTGAIIPSDAIIQWARIVRQMTSASNSEGSHMEIKADYYDFGGSPMVAADWKAFANGDPNIYFENGMHQGRELSSGIAKQTYCLKDLSGIIRSGEANAQGFTGYTGIREGTRTAGWGPPTGDNQMRTASYENTTEVPVYLEVAWYQPVSAVDVTHVLLPPQFF